MRYSGDPRWITVRRPAHCAHCDTLIQRGDSAFYYPRTRELYCSICGDVEARRFRAEAFDESALTGVW